MTKLRAAGATLREIADDVGTSVFTAHQRMQHLPDWRPKEVKLYALQDGSILIKSDRPDITALLIKRALKKQGIATS